MRFIQKKPEGEKPLILNLDEDRQGPPDDDYHSMNFTLITPNYEEVAAGRCSIMLDDNEHEIMYISAIYVTGHSNYPTKLAPNKYVGLGQILVFTAIKFGLDLGVKKVTLAPLDGSEGFYIKMGLYPQVKSGPNRMNVEGVSKSLNNGRLNPKWIHDFESSSFRHNALSDSTWVGSIPDIYPRLRGSILEAWTITE
ncbi:N-acetyltransferase [Lelliottia aquatilis]|uniref:GNAT family N-acetyltransferase n=1 Tax=Lelliottia aquatilis TaxID=2080838 RepID=UPI000CDE88E3|nr:GNAT family N-acetyltransferase [Lelliottia aquatilis]POZ13687.1 N-acetyltransferase [Lelliottia aquatilis]